MRYQFYTADVFTDQIFGGNQLAVFPHADGLTDRQMQTVARELNLSETVFVKRPQNPAHTRQLRIFTPGMELPFAGHPTVGSAFVLAQIGEIKLDGAATDIIFEEGVGPVPVTIMAESDRPVSAQLSAAMMPEVGPPPPTADQLAELLNLTPADIVQGAYAPEAVSCGVPFLFVPLKDLAALGRAHINQSAWQAHVANYWAPHIFAFTLDTGGSAADLRARMFAPQMGITEDPATGAAATALGGYLAARQTAQNGTLRWLVEQGFEMQRPSQINIEVDMQESCVIAVRVGGSSVMVSEGLIEIPDLG